MSRPTKKPGTQIAPIVDLKAEERRIVGELLIEFFEIERDLNQVLYCWFVAPAEFEALEMLLDSAPLRYRIKAAGESGVLSAAEASMFQTLCDQRNRLAHGPTKGRTILGMFPKAAQAKFIEECQLLRGALKRAMDEILRNM